MIQPNPYIEALYIVLADEAAREDELGDVMRSVQANYPNVCMLHLVYRIGDRPRKLAVVVEADIKPALYTVYWPADVDAAEVKSKLMEEGTVAAEVQLVVGDLFAAVAVVRSIVMTQILTQKAHDKEGSTGEKVG